MADGEGVGAEPHVLALLHEVWLAIHVKRFAKQDGTVGGPDNFYNGCIKAEFAVAEVAERYGISHHHLRNPEPEVPSV